jgi:hypothetical protein
MKATYNNSELELRISEDCIDIYVDEKHAGDFSIEMDNDYAIVTPNAIDFENINKARQGFYTFVIDSILEGELNNEMSETIKEELEIEVEGFIFRSVLRTEKACNFWNKRGYNVPFCEEEREKQEQEEIEINF